MNPVALVLLGLEALTLAILVLGLFRLRGRFGLTPLYVMIGVFQPIQVMLSSSIFFEVAPGWPVSPGTLMFAATLLAMLVVYIREDAEEARNITFGVLAANFGMTLLLYTADWYATWPGALRLIDVPPALFSQGARVTIVGTLALVADVSLLLALYTGLRRLMAHQPLLRAWLTLAGVLAFDALVFITGAFVERPDYPALLATGLVSKFAVGTLFAALLVMYLRWFDSTSAGVPADHPLRDFFYAFTWRDRFEQQADAHAREREQVFERITDAFVALDTEWRYTYVNSKAASTFGRTPEDLIGRHIWDEFPEGRDELFAQAYRSAMEDQQPRTIEAYYPPYDRWFENRIYPSPQGLTIYFHDITERVRLREELLRRATVHELTGLPNRHVVRERLDALLRDRADTEPVGVIVLNLDRLHHVNDTLGYAAGDEVVKEAARRLVHWSEGREWTVGGIGGDEFLLVGEGHGAESLPAITREATDALAASYEIGARTVHLTVSAGVSWFPAAGRTASALLEQADLALNLAKQRGRGQVGMFSAARADDVRDRLQLDTRLRSALAHDAFELHYQPLVDASTGRIVAAEALMRWTDEELGPVAPSRFIPAAEDTGAIVRMGDWALRRALADLRGWQAARITPVPLSVNVSAVQMQRPEFVHDVAALLRDGGMPAHLLRLELTESALMGDDEGAVAMLAALKALGVGLSLDDFGTGYSSLARLRRLPIDEMKIDRSFVEGIGTHGPGETLCRAIIGMGQTLRCHVVAEGVETAEQARFLADSGCHTLQGYLYSRPVPATTFAGLLARGARWSRVGEAVT